MSITFEAVSTREDVEALAVMANQIWTEYWPDLIGEAQTRYMVEQFQSVDAILRDVSEHAYRYWFLVDEAGKRVGYTGGAAEMGAGEDAVGADCSTACHNPIVGQRWARRFFISKIYIFASERGKHYASQVVRFYEGLCRAEGLQAMYLTVNKGNDLGIRAYAGNGFEVVDEQAVDIGSGFVMDDYVMAREVC